MSGVIRWVLFCVLGMGVARAELVRREWKVEGATREGLVHFPAAAAPDGDPVVFVFHGHGGSARQAARSMPLHEHWPEAVVVYLQGLPTPGRLTDPEGLRNGWQAAVGDQNDRDLKFFDTALAVLKAERTLDRRRVYAMGHSNGGAFTYLLWARRREQFAAFAPSGAVAGRLDGPLPPAPVIHVAGENDPLVKFSWQRTMINALRRLNGCTAEERAGPNCTLYTSPRGTPVMTYIHGGGHEFPAEAMRPIAGFFRAHPPPAASR